MKSRLPTALIVAGVAVLSLTPLAPESLRRGDVLALYAYRPFASGLNALRKKRAGAEDPDAAPGVAAVLLGNVESRLAQRDRVLIADAQRSAPGSACVLARVVDVDPRTRKLLVDAGAGVVLSKGDAVLAGRHAVGVVERAVAGFAVIRTPWTPRARFAGETTGAGPGAPTARFVLVGENRPEWIATVLSPETRLGNIANREVRSAEANDLVPTDLLALPPGLRIGTLEPDLLTARTGRETFCVRPFFDLRLLDAVVVLTRAGVGSRPESGFSTAVAERLQPTLLSGRRDGEGFFVPRAFDVLPGAAVARHGMLLGFVDAALLGAARSRGVADPGQELVLLVLGQESSRTVAARALRRLGTGGRFLLTGGDPLQAGDLVVSAGRGVHCPRGLLLGQVTRTEGAVFSLERPFQGAFGDLTVYRRTPVPDLPWSP